MPFHPLIIFCANKNFDDTAFLKRIHKKSKNHCCWILKPSFHLHRSILILRFSSTLLDQCGMPANFGTGAFGSMHMQASSDNMYD